MIKFKQFMKNLIQDHKALRRIFITQSNIYDWYVCQGSKYSPVPSMGEMFVSLEIAYFIGLFYSGTFTLLLFVLLADINM